MLDLVAEGPSSFSKVRRACKGQIQGVALQIFSKYFSIANTCQIGCEDNNCVFVLFLPGNMIIDVSECRRLISMHVSKGGG